MNSTDYIAIGGLITIIGTVIVNIIVALRTNAKIDKVDAKADVITGHVNSAASASVTKIDGLQIQITQLRSDLAAKDQTAAVLAATTAIKDNQ